LKYGWIRVCVCLCVLVFVLIDFLDSLIGILLGDFSVCCCCCVDSVQNKTKREIDHKRGLCIIIFPSKENTLMPTTSSSSTTSSATGFIHQNQHKQRKKKKKETKLFALSSFVFLVVLFWLFTFFFCFFVFQFFKTVCPFSWLFSSIFQCVVARDNAGFWITQCD